MSDIKKQFVKMTFEDIEIAETFFDNEKHLSEFLFNVFKYYRGKEITIKTKIVSKYFETYKKTMNFIIASKIKGKEGGDKRVENQVIINNTLQGLVEPIVKPLPQPNNKEVISNNKEVIINDKLIIEKEIKMYSKEVHDCFEICLKSFDDHLQPKDEKTNNAWLDTIEKLNRIENIPFDKINDIVKKARNNDFWSKNFLSLTKLRKKNKDGIFYIVVFNEQLKKSTTSLQVAFDMIDKLDLDNR